jgi:hypothetical protein
MTINNAMKTRETTVAAISVPRPQRAVRVWMVTAFVAGLIFAALLAQAISAGKGSPGQGYIPPARELPGINDFFKPGAAADYGYSVNGIKDLALCFG